MAVDPPVGDRARLARLCGGKNAADGQGSAEVRRARRRKCSVERCRPPHLMKELLEALAGQWKDSRPFRLWTILAAIALLINLSVTVLWQLEILSFGDAPPANDLQIYLDAGGRFLQRQDLYIAPRADFGLFAYSPAFAMLSGLLTFLPYKLVWVFDALLHILAYGLLYWRWFLIFRRQGLGSSAEQLIRLFPLWIVFTGLLYEIAYMNIYIFMALIATLLLEALLNQQAGKAILWLSIL